MNTLSVNDIKTVNNYPYGSLKTTATFSLEFNNKKGFRSVFQTVNPKTGVINKPRKGTYSDIMYMTDTDGFINFYSNSFYKLEDFNSLTDFLYTNFSLFTPEQVTYLYGLVIRFLKLEVYALAVYCNVKAEISRPLIDPTLKKAIEAMKSGINVFNDLKLDHVAIEALKDPNYSPFTTIKHE